MANQSPSKRRASAKKATASRRQTAANRSRTQTRSSARRTASSARETSRSAQRTARFATRTAGRRLEAAASRLDAFGRQVERTLLIQLGASATFRDAVTRTAKTYTSRDRVVRELNKFERRGNQLVGRGQRAAKRRRNDL